MKRNTVPVEAIKKAYSKRIYAGILDVIMWVILAIIAADTFGTKTSVVQGNTKSINVSLTGWPAAIFLLTAIAYFVFFEWQFGGTVGKLMQGISVVDDSGGRITLKQSAIRNILRIVDAFPYIIPYVIGIISIAGDDRDRRFGDKVAHTVVAVNKAGKRQNTKRWDIPS